VGFLGDLVKSIGKAIMDEDYDKEINQQTIDNFIATHPNATDEEIYAYSCHLDEDC
jgi:hypothetical protein